MGVNQACAWPVLLSNRCYIYCFIVVHKKKLINIDKEIMPS